MRNLPGPGRLVCRTRGSPTSCRAASVPGMRYAGIVVAGGAARRLSGVDKPALSVGGKPLLARAIHALGGAERGIVVGPRRPGFDVVWTREPVPGTGPVAALAAGLAVVPGDVETVAVLAADL